MIAFFLNWDWTKGMSRQIYLSVPEVPLKNKRKINMSIMRRSLMKIKTE
jgi:hypothetical protein